MIKNIRINFSNLGKPKLFIEQFSHEIHQFINIILVVAIPTEILVCHAFFLKI